ncbi:Uu.00g051360.m01.CDS01 [Anthostomella pinea]|uniref:Uu.00g051360.m01.CDS01 n=1 Tax=Anthostomella pinea TaxID=933095 RepID=A0AAI8VSW0_9PEZI|nr:Uu.00g051360.m01.CDS01 [Anthostomella pinea]
MPRCVGWSSLFARDRFWTIKVLLFSVVLRLVVEIGPELKLFIRILSIIACTYDILWAFGIVGAPDTTTVAEQLDDLEESGEAVWKLGLPQTQLQWKQEDAAMDSNVGIPALEIAIADLCVNIVSANFDLQDTISSQYQLDLWRSSLPGLIFLTKLDLALKQINDRTKACKEHVKQQEDDAWRRGRNRWNKHRGYLEKGDYSQPPPSLAKGNKSPLSSVYTALDEPRTELTHTEETTEENTLEFEGAGSLSWEDYESQGNASHDPIKAHREVLKQQIASERQKWA